MRSVGKFGTAAVTMRPMGRTFAFSPKQQGAKFKHQGGADETERVLSMRLCSEFRPHGGEVSSQCGRRAEICLIANPRDGRQSEQRVPLFGKQTSERRGKNTKRSTSKCSSYFESQPPLLQSISSFGFQRSASVAVYYQEQSCQPGRGPAQVRTQSACKDGGPVSGHCLKEGRGSQLRSSLPSQRIRSCFSLFPDGQWRRSSCSLPFTLALRVPRMHQSVQYMLGRSSSRCLP